MDEKKRKANETEYDLWTDNDKGGRIYYFEINGKLGWKAKYLKEMDKDEITIRFWQEIYEKEIFFGKFMKSTLLIKGIKK